MHAMHSSQHSLLPHNEAGREQWAGICRTGEQSWGDPLWRVGRSITTCAI